MACRCRFGAARHPPGVQFFIELRGNNLTLSLPVAVQLDSPIHDAGDNTNAHFGKLRGNLRFSARSGAFFSGSVAVVVLMFGYLLWIVTQLRYVFRSVSQPLPFVAENARRIRWVGLAVNLRRTWTSGDRVFLELLHKPAFHGQRPALCPFGRYQRDHDCQRPCHPGNRGSVSRGSAAAGRPVAHHLSHGYTCQAGWRAAGARDYAHRTGRACRTNISEPVDTKDKQSESDSIHNAGRALPRTQLPARRPA